MVNVTQGVNGNVALKCHVCNANPPLQIEWFARNSMLTLTNNTLCFLVNGHHLLIQGLAQAQINASYHCEVTNARLHERISSITMYELDDSLSSNNLICTIYKPFENKITFLGKTVELSYIAGTGSTVYPCGL